MTTENQLQQARLMTHMIQQIEAPQPKSVLSRSHHLCPVCNNPLYSVKVPEGRHVYCPNPRCWNDAAGKGATAASEGEAYGKMIRLVDNEA